MSSALRWKAGWRRARDRKKRPPTFAGGRWGRETDGTDYPEAPAPGTSVPARWWKYRRVHSAFGFKFWAFVVGAAPLASELEEFWRRMGFVVLQGYGLTETAPIVTLRTSTRDLGP